ncbi:sporulation integral membrane protein YlbJ [Bacillus lacus]|uniref:Sporulation integral membrane protein YlbJ n=1 Tax=Metabacillus lacus TaxID=1983721 RepID=A0A7X2IWS5_9BACI|nr:sporulation integral membrane protein YlbJ [Metabacillus lacus]MRX70887.1 sporulation integral membrane protein YlbJ [Metabacillus lacus]
MLTSSKLRTLLLTFIISFLTVNIMLHPQISFDASKAGLNLWWEIVFPSLLPFFIVSELLIGFGVVKFIGVLLEPLMRPVFKVPGVGGFVWAMGMASGFPAGAKLTARLRQEQQLSKIEAERLVSFTNSSNPLFIFGAVAVGFFHDETLGILLAAAHYLGNICVGLTMRFYGRDDQESHYLRNKNKFPSLIEAFREMHRTRIKENRPLGKLLGDAVISSIQSLLMIGGFIILFSVFNRLLAVIQLTDLAGAAAALLLSTFSIPAELSIPLISGLFETTLGNQLTSQVSAELMHKGIIASFILAFSGFSIHAQVASILAPTDIRFQPFFYARILQGLYSSVFAFLLWDPLYEGLQAGSSNTIPAFSMFAQQTWAVSYWEMLSHLGPSITILSLLVYIIVYALRMDRKPV